MPRIDIGFDSGKKGAAAAFIDGELIEVMRFADVIKTKNIDNYSTTFITSLHDFLARATEYATPKTSIYITLEQVWGMPSQSSSTTFTQAFYYTQLQTTLLHFIKTYRYPNNITFTVISPKKWINGLGIQYEKEMNKSQKKQVNKSFAVDNTTLPSLSRQTVEVMDAVCIGLYSYKHFKQKG